MIKRIEPNYYNFELKTYAYDLIPSFKTSTLNDTCEWIDVTVHRACDTYLIKLFSEYGETAYYMAESKSEMKQLKDVILGLESLESFRKYLTKLTKDYDLIRRFFKAMDVLINGGVFVGFELFKGLNNLAEKLAYRDCLHYVNLDTIKRKGYYLVSYDANNVTSYTAKELVEETAIIDVLTELKSLYGLETIFYHLYIESETE